MNIIKRAWLWLTTKHEDTKVSEPITDNTAAAEPVTV